MISLNFIWYHFIPHFWGRKCSAFLFFWHKRISLEHYSHTLNTYLCLFTSNFSFRVMSRWHWALCECSVQIDIKRLSHSIKVNLEKTHTHQMEGWLHREYEQNKTEKSNNNSWNMKATCITKCNWVYYTHNRYYHFPLV